MVCQATSAICHPPEDKRAAEAAEAAGVTKDLEEVKEDLEDVKKIESSWRRVAGRPTRKTMGMASTM